MKYERLTTDKPQNNKDFLLNFAFVKDGEVYLRGMGDDGEEIRLCDYIAIRATSEKGCERTPQDILDGACNECHCELAALNIVAIQAAELRNRLAELEDKIENGKNIELPCKVGDTVYRRHSSCYSEWTATKINLYLSANSIDYCLCVTDKEGLCGDDFFAKDDEGYEWLLTKPQAE